MRRNLAARFIPALIQSTVICIPEHRATRKMGATATKGSASTAFAKVGQASCDEVTTYFIKHIRSI